MELTNEPTESVARPRAVSNAVLLFYTAFAIGAIRAVFDLIRRTSGVSFFVVLLALGIFLLVCVLFVRQIAAGKNWARIVFLVLLLIGLPFAIPTYLTELKTSLVHGIVSIIVALLQVAGTVLLFSGESNRWFRRHK